LEIVETPPSPVGRSLIWLLISLFVIALTWAVLGKTDEVAVAMGKVVPSGYTKIVQAEDRGIVTKIHVENGSRVKQGDLLIELDTVITEADVSRLTNERDFYRLTHMRLTAEKEGTPFVTDELKDYDPVELARQTRLYQSRMDDYASRLRVAEKSVEQAKEQERQARIQRDKLAVQVRMAREREEKTRVMVEQGGISHFTWQEYNERYQSLRQDLNMQESEILRSRRALEQAEAELRRISDERMKDITSQVVDAARNLRVIEEELKKAEEKHRLTQIRAPIDGVVQQLEVHTIGAVVTPAQPLMQVVPDGEGVQFEVWAINRDIGFIY
jgi:hemolysin D